MTTVQAEIYDAFRSVGADEPTAMKAAAAFSSRDQDMTSIKTDVAAMNPIISKLETDVSVLKFDVSVLKSDVSELKFDVSVLKSDVSELKADVRVLKWMMGFVLAFQAGILLKLIA
jgi:outer membrane murein-binding lipoprotein Lpp